MKRAYTARNVHWTFRGNKANFFASHASFANIILEAWYPQTQYKHVPQLAVVSKALTQSEALKQDENTVAPLHQVRDWAKSAGAHIKVSELLTFDTPWNRTFRVFTAETTCETKAIDGNSLLLHCCLTKRLLFHQSCALMISTPSSVRPQSWCLH